ncbi:MAG: carboxymuconolactone decarboxylase family protein, partial [Thermoplasmata archaeon]|nr:carboxymuconolactone decarboxylase family protein [Thermoplasmata archaeon]
MEQNVEEMRDYRDKMNERIIANGGKVTRRFFALDHQAYEEGAIPKEYKELMGLVASLVLRCDGCIFYHLDQCVDLGLTDEELDEA